MGVGAWLLHAVQGASLPALLVCMALETLGLPLPGESALIAAAAAAGAGKLSIYGVLAAAFVGSTIGDNAGYLIGRYIGRRTIISHGKRVGITEARYAKVERIIDRYGVLVVIGARFVVLLRQLNGLAAGSAGMSWKKFLFANLVGAALWVGFWGLLAYFLGKTVDFMPALGKHWTLVAAAVVPLIIAGVPLYFFWWRRRAA